jgi:hypothetical protein
MLQNHHAALALMLERVKIGRPILAISRQRMAVVVVW